MFSAERLSVLVLGFKKTVCDYLNVLFRCAIFDVKAYCYIFSNVI